MVISSFFSIIIDYLSLSISISISLSLIIVRFESFGQISKRFYRVKRALLYCADSTLALGCFG